MMTLEEIQNAKINADIAREAYEQASKRLQDTLETKKTFEQKAFTLFSGYITVSLALLGVGGAIFKDHGLISLVLPFWIAGFIFACGAIAFVAALIDDTYGALASDPDMWLLPGTIDGDETILPRMLTYITYHHHERISSSTAANNKKAANIRIGIYLGLAAPFVLLVSFLLPSLWHAALTVLFH